MDPHDDTEKPIPVRAEVLVEPFVEGRPGAHVEAVTTSLVNDGIDIDMGPFATTFEGSLASLLEALERAVQAGFGAGATAIQFRVERR